MQKLILLMLIIGYGDCLRSAEPNIRPRVLRMDVLGKSADLPFAILEEAHPTACSPVSVLLDISDNTVTGATLTYDTKSEPRLKIDAFHDWIENSIAKPRSLESIAAPGRKGGLWAAKDRTLIVHYVYYESDSMFQLIFLTRKDKISGLLRDSEPTSPKKQ